MILEEEHHFFESNTLAAMWIPIRLLISVAIISCFTAMVIIGSQQVSITREQNRFTQEINSIKQSLETLYRHGSCRNIHDILDTPGSKRVFTLYVPRSISSVYFGRTLLESEEYASTIRYGFSQTSKILWMNAKICVYSAEYSENQWQPEKNHTGFQLSSGHNQFTAELVCNNTNQFILLYSIEKE